MSESPEVSILDPGERSRVRPGGAVGSVQEAQIRVPREMLERTWSADNLELLARAYWAFLRRMSLGVIRVLYAPTSRTVAAFGKIPLLRFGAPIYEAESGRGRFSRFGAWLYAQTQLRIHVLVCNAFLRSIPRLDFPAIDRSAMPSDRAAVVAER